MIPDRQIFVHNNYSDQKFRETLSDLMIALMLSPDELWLVSPWITDFNLLDNRAGEWDGVNPDWGCRYVTFVELLGAIVDCGSTLKVVMKDDDINQKFKAKLSDLVSEVELVTYYISETVHTKGFLSSEFFLAGSMNFTYSGTNKNDEHIKISIEPRVISEARLEFENKYELT